MRTTAEKEVETNVQVYPNPAKSKLFIDLDKENTQLKVFNVLGEKVYEEKIKTIATSIDVCNWDNGIYIFVLENVKDLKTFKIEVE